MSRVSLRSFLGLSGPLWRLNWMLGSGALRSLCRRSFTVSGLYLFGILVGMLVVLTLDRARVIPTLVKLFFLFSPTVLTLLVLFAIRTGLTGTAFYFTPAETSFLLTAPIPHRQLVNYKLHQLSFLVLFVSVAGSLCLCTRLGAFPQVFAKIYFVLLFLQLFPLVLASFVPNDEVRGVVILRRLVDSILVVMLLSMALAMYFRTMGQLRISLFWSYLFAQITRPVAAVDFLLWHKSAQVAMRIVAMLFVTDLSLAVLFFFRCDRLQLESLFNTNLRSAMRQPRWLRGVFGGRVWRSSRDIQVLPFWRGYGPHLWRKLKELRRRRNAIFFLAVLMLLGFSALMLFLRKLNGAQSPIVLPWHMLFSAEIFSVLGLLFARFADFRSDGDKMEILLSLPVSAGKLAASGVAIAAGGLAVYLAFLGGLGGEILFRSREMDGFLVGGLLTVPLTALIFVLAINIIALLFPATPGTSGKFVLSLLTQFGAVLSGVIFLGRGLYLLQHWAYVQSDGHGFSFFLLSLGPMLAVILSEAVLLVLAVRSFNPAKLTA